MKRDYRFDNIKFILIFLVVFGHLLELISGSASADLYRIIYSFHMPAFIFVSGYFAKFNPKKILLKLVWLYLLFQVLYLLFNSALFGTPLDLQFTTPYWIMWYMLVMIFSYCLIPLIDTPSPKKRAVILGLAIIASLAAGFDNNIGYFMSLSRFFTFFPYFLAGYYLKRSTVSLEGGGVPWKRALLLLGLTALVVASVVFILFTPTLITARVMYGSYSYEAAAYGPLIKLALLAIASCWILFLIKVIPAKKIPILTLTGAHTLSIYILHGFIIKYLSTTQLFTFDETIDLLLALGISLGVVLVLGSKPVARLFNICFTGDWVEALFRATTPPAKTPAHGKR